MLSVLNQRGLERITCPGFPLKKELMKSWKYYPYVDAYWSWLCATDYVLEGKGLENEDGVIMYE